MGQNVHIERGSHGFPLAVKIFALPPSYFRYGFSPQSL
jgi:hypothetical protein